MGHAFRYDALAAAPRTAWVRDVGRTNLRIIGFAEILASIALVFPAALGLLPWLTPLAAAMLALLMVCAIVFHARRPNEGPNVVFNLILGALALTVAMGRSVIQPF